ncbi:MAG TPA: glycosyltransferase family 39 protein, partial [Candidatus Binatia bacterium]
MGRKSREKAATKTRGAPAPKTAPAAAKPPGRRRAALAIVGIFALVFSIVAVTALTQKSNTMDEPVHVLAGYSYLRWADYRINPEHPPLAKLWAALPLLALSKPTSVNNDPRYARYLSGTITAANLGQFFPGVPIEKVFFYPKLQMVLLAVGLGIFVFAWASELFGLEAAAAALFLYALDPNILANSQIVHTDIPFAAFCFACIYFLWRAFRRLSWPNALFFCLFFGLAAAAKHSFVLIIPIGIALGLMKIFSPEPIPAAIGAARSLSGRGAKTRAVAAMFAGALLSAYVLLWACYGFRFSAMAGHSLSVAALLPEQGWLRSSVSLLLDLGLFPEAWIDGQLFNLKFLTRTAYLLGDTSDTGFWLFFPVALAVKTPVPTLLLVAAAVYLIARRRLDRPAGLFLLVPVAI